MVRLEPEFLSYRWYENRWYFTSAAGALPITPGDGRWILHVPGGRLTPWMHGLWAALGTAYIAKRHAMLYRDNYCAKLANPARLAYAPSGATEAQRFGFFRRMLGWGPNTVLELPPGWEAKLLESNGRGWEVFQKQIDTSDREFMIALAGQVITTQGGSGFDGQDVAQDIKQDLIQGDADALAYTINTQGLPQYIAAHFGEDALQSATIVEWDTGTSVDKERETRTLGQVADAIARLTSALAPYDRQVDIAEVATRFAVPTKEGAADVAVTMPVLESGEAGAGNRPERGGCCGERRRRRRS
jgi:phage gp29-like protein